MDTIVESVIDDELELKSDRTSTDIRNDDTESIKEDDEEPPKKVEYRVIIPEIQWKKPDIDESEFPETFKDSTDEEKLIIEFAENFRRQYVFLYRDRKPLFLYPLNECGIEKFICSTVRPTLLPYEDIWDVYGAASFVADYLAFEALENPTELPTYLYSPTTVLRLQKGNCLDFSTLLCSLLIGAGYDAYVVSGYATKEMCLMDESREICPLLQIKEKEVKNVEEVQPRKYAVRPPKDLLSKFEKKMVDRLAEEQADREVARKKQEELDQLERDKPPPDPLFGMRIHSWVAVLSGKREVPETYFVDAFTGNAHSPKHQAYLGIESLWNHSNYWVNMQDCSGGCKDLNFDLGDCSKWEFMFPQTEKPHLIMFGDEPENLDDDDEESKEEEKEERIVDLPPSWVPMIQLTRAEFESRCPQGKRTLLYKRSKLEKFAPYLLKDGMIQRLSVYEDMELKELTSMKVWYKFRKDKLTTRVLDHFSGTIHETFAPGRQRSLKEQTYEAAGAHAESRRTMTYYHDSRVDGLYLHEQTPTEMTNHFKNRSDFLYFRRVTFGKRPKKFGPADSGRDSRPIIDITEKFHRNPEKEADIDIQERIYQIAEEKIQLTYHRVPNKIAASTREFIKPPHVNERGVKPIMTTDMTSCFYSDHAKIEPKNLATYQHFVELLEDENDVIEAIRATEEEMAETLADRLNEEATSYLDKSFYDTERNEKYKQMRSELERQEMEDKMRRDDLELDYLAPFLALIGHPEQPNRQQAYKLKEDCLADLKTRLIDKANLIQARFEKETHELQKKQQWYQQNQVSMTKENEEEYLHYCSEAMFRIHILELRLNRHKELSPQKYLALEHRLKTDPRLADYF